LVVNVGIRYGELVDMVYEAIAVDKARFDLRLEAVYVSGPRSMPRTLINSDAAVKFFMAENLLSIQHRTPLCVTVSPKTIQARSIEHHTVVAETNPANPTLLYADGPLIDLNEEPTPSKLHTFIYEDSPIFDFNEAGADLTVHALDMDPMGFQRRGSLPMLKVDETEKSLSLNEVGANNVETPGTQSSCLRRKASGDADKGWVAPMLSSQDLAATTEVATISFDSERSLVVDEIYESKENLKRTANMYAMKNNFEFVVKKSSPTIWFITCKAPSCCWRLRGKKLPGSAMFTISKFSPDHTCTLELRHKDHRQAAPWVVGHVIKKKYANDGAPYLPNNIIKDMKEIYGIQMTYEKAWRCKEKALEYVRGTPEASYSKLPSFLYAMQQKNPGTIHDLVIVDGRFRYCYFALGASVHGFRSCRPVLCVDGTFLKAKYGGQMLCAVALDANNHLFPVAFAIVDSENNMSWTYFLGKLKESLGKIENLVFVSDRHQSIATALEAVFPEAHHGACYHHIIMNVAHRFKSSDCRKEIFKAAYAYTKSEYHLYFSMIRDKDPAVADYLEGIGVQRWSRAFFPGNRYDIMTSNYAESFNNKTRDARSWPITSFVEFLRFTIQSWFYEKNEAVGKCTTFLAPAYESKVTTMANHAKTLHTFGIGQYEFQVRDGEEEAEVNLAKKECSCQRWQLIGIPCVHAIAAALKRGISIYTLCDNLYTTETWKAIYAGNIYPCGNEDGWHVPDEIRNMQVGLPVEKAPTGRPRKVQGRPKRKRHPSQGEHLIVERKCSRCHVRGHNRASCKTRL
jgi:hypothetical protein